MKEKSFDLTDKVAIVTGGAGLLGTEFCSALQQAGAKVASFDTKKQKTPLNVVCIQCSVAKDVSIKRAVEKTIKFFGQIDILINAAGLNPPPDDEKNYLPYEKFSISRWKREIEVGLTGAHICIQQIAPHMMKRRLGVIINIASDLALIAPNNSVYKLGKFKSPAYVAAKAGLLGLTRAWASYLAPHGIRVNALAPGGVYNGQNAEFVEKNYSLNMMNRMANKNDYNGAIIFLCSDESSYMTGSVMVIDGGRTAW